MIESVRQEKTINIILKDYKKIFPKVESNKKPYNFKTL